MNGILSDTRDVLSGIPQEIVLGPILINIYINDILDKINSEGFLSADDTKIFRPICCKEDAVVLQSDIDAIEEWSDTWLLRFNPKKCLVLLLGSLENTKYTMLYKENNNEMEQVFEEKDLGVIADMELKFEEHIT